MRSLRLIITIVAWIGAFATTGFAQETDNETVQVFSEKTSFENFVKSQQELKRRPAGLNLKFRVISVRRELALTEAESKLTPQDVIINGGVSEGLEEGMVLTVVRKVPIIDPFLDNRQLELEIKFATVKVIHSQDNLAVARVEKMESASKGAGVGVRGVLIGDFLSLQ